MRARQGHFKDTTARRAFFDRVRGVLVLGVVAGHTMMVVKAAPGPIDTLAHAIALIRMPAFFLISGVLLKHRPLRSQMISVAQRLGPLYLVGVGLNALVTLFFYRQLEVKLLPPEWGLWFLLALGVYRLVSSLFWDYGLAVAFAIAASLFASMIELPQSIWLARTFMLAPFFAAGVWLGADRLERLAERLGWMRSMLILGTCVFMVQVIIELTPLKPSTLQWRIPLTAFGFSPLLAAFINITILSAALGASLGTIGIIARTKKNYWLEFVGRKSFVVLIGHFAIFDALRASWRPQFESEFALLLVIVGLTVIGTLVPIATLWLFKGFQRGIRMRMPGV